MRILTNACNDVLRSRAKQKLVPFEENEPMAATPQIDPLPLKEAMDQLSTDQRVVTLLHNLEGYSLKERRRFV